MTTELRGAYQRLSPRARRLWGRVKAGGWYAACDKRTPKAMQELVDAGLVGVAGRPKVIMACYVPATSGFRPYRPERFGRAR